MSTIKKRRPIKEKERDLRDPKEQAMLMTVVLLERYQKNREMVHQILQDRLIDIASQINAHKGRMLERPVKLSPWQRFIRFLCRDFLAISPPKIETINGVIMDELTKDLKITTQAIEVLEREAGRDLLRRSDRPRKYSD